MLVPTWEFGVVLDRGHNEFFVCVGELFFRKLEDRRTVINLGFYQQLQFAFDFQVKILCSSPVVCSDSAFYPHKSLSMPPLPPC